MKDLRRGDCAVYCRVCVKAENTHRGAAERAKNVEGVDGLGVKAQGVAVLVSPGERNPDGVVAALDRLKDPRLGSGR